MLRATMTQPGVIEFDDVPLPMPGPGEVLVKVRRIGVCGSDMHVYRGKHPYTSYPVVQGHEFSAEIASVSNASTDLALGALVTAPPQISCGKCYTCRRGQYHICENLKVIGFQAPGVAQQYFVFRESDVVRLPQNFTPELGALVEPTAVAVHAVHRATDVAGLGVLVLGAGPIGNLVAQVARARGADPVVITDLSKYRLGIARQCGIQNCVCAERESTDTEILSALAGAELAFECVGSEVTANQAVRHVRKGSTVVIVGVYGERPKVDLGLVQDRELQLIGTLMYQRRDYEEAVRLLAAGDVVARPLFTASFPFRRYLDAYKFIEESRDHTMKVMIDLDR